MSSAVRRFDARLDAAVADLVTDALPPSTTMAARMAPHATRRRPTSGTLASTLLAGAFVAFAVVGVVATAASISDAMGSAAEREATEPDLDRVDCYVGGAIVEVPVERVGDTGPEGMVAHCFGVEPFDADRQAAMVCAQSRARSAAARVEANAPIELSGPAGRIRFNRDSGEVTHIAYDGLSIFLDAGECAVTPGAVDEATGLMAALVECPDIADVRGEGVISMAGVVALPADALLGRGDLPPTGGIVEVDGSTITLDEAEIFLDGEPLDETGRISWGVFDADRVSGILLEFDPGLDRWFLRDAFSNEDFATLVEPCPIAAEELGRINDYTTVMRLDIDCTEVALEGGGTGSVTGTIVADVIRGYTETRTEP